MAVASQPVRPAPRLNCPPTRLPPRNTTMDENKKRALSAALGQIEKQFGKGSVMRMGDRVVEAGRNHRHRLADAGHRAGHRRPAQGPRGRDLRSGILRQDHADPAGHRRVPEDAAAPAAFIDAEHALDPIYAAKLGVNVDDLLLSQPDTGEQALEIADMLVRSERGRHGGDRLGRRADPEGRNRGRDGRPAARPAGAPDEPGPAQAHRQHQALQLHGDLHQPAAHEDRRDDAGPEPGR